MLKETFKFWASGCHVKRPLPPPPHTRYCYEGVRQVRTEGGCDMAAPIFPT